MYALDADMTVPGFERIVAENAVLERVSHGLVFTEGPVWDARQGALIWTDIRGDKILRWAPGKGQTTILEPTGQANGLTLTPKTGSSSPAGDLARCGDGSPTACPLSQQVQKLQEGPAHLVLKCLGQRAQVPPE